MLGRSFCTSCATSSGLAVACLMTPSAMAGLPLKRTTQALVQRPELGVADIGKPHQIAVGLLDDQVVELLRRAQIGLGQHGELALLAFDAAGRHLDVLAPQRRLDVLRRQAVGGEPLADRARCAWNIRRSPNRRTSATPGSVCS